MAELIDGIEASKPASDAAMVIQNPVSPPTVTVDVTALEHNLDSARAEIKRLRADNVRLQENLFAEMDVTLAGGGDGSIPVEETKLKSSLIRSQRDVVSL
jgi:hypothetical protein